MGAWPEPDAVRTMGVPRMRFTLKLAVFALFPLLLAGCGSLATGFPAQVESPVILATVLDKPNIEKLQKAYNDPTDAASRKAARNELVYAYLAQVDANYGGFIRTLNQGKVDSSLAFGLGALGLSTGAVIADGKRTKDVLTALSAGVVSAGTLVDKELFYERTVSTLVAQMESDRATIRTQIVSALTTLSADEYPLMQASGDVDRYIFAGSIPGALTNIQKNAGVAAEKANQSIDLILKREDVTLQASQRVKDLVTQIRALSTDDAKAILATLAQSGTLDAELQRVKTNVGPAFDSNPQQALRMLSTEIGPSSTQFGVLQSLVAAKAKTP